MRRQSSTPTMQYGAGYSNKIALLLSWHHCLTCAILAVGMADSYWHVIEFRVMTDYYRYKKAIHIHVHYHRFLMRLAAG